MNLLVAHLIGFPKIVGLDDYVVALQFFADRAFFF